MAGGGAHGERAQKRGTFKYFLPRNPNPPEIPNSRRWSAYNRQPQTVKRKPQLLTTGGGASGSRARKRGGFKFFLPRNPNPSETPNPRRWSAHDCQPQTTKRKPQPPAAGGGAHGSRARERSSGAACGGGGRGQPPARCPGTSLGFLTPMAQGRSTKIISMIEWIGTSELSIKNFLSTS